MLKLRYHNFKHSLHSHNVEILQDCPKKQKLADVKKLNFTHITLPRVDTTIIYHQFNWKE